MESPRKRAWGVAGAPQDDDPASLLVDDLKLDASFLQDELLDLPPLDDATLLALDSSGDAFPDIDFFSEDPAAVGPADGNAAELGGLFAGDAGSLLPGGSSAQTRASPSTSESGNGDDAGPARVPSPSSAATGAAESAGSEPPRSRASAKAAAAATAASEDEAKRQARMQRNRENAFLSRQRKKQQMMDLQQSCTALRTQATQLTCLVHKLVAENCLLRHHLGAACKTAGIPVPEVPSAMKPAMPAVPAAVGPGAVPAAGVAAAAPGVMLRPGVVVPVAAVAAAQAAARTQAAAPAAATAAPAAVAPAPAPAAAPAAPAAPAPAATPAAPARPARAAKRARLTGAGAAFLAMFSVFLFAAPLGPGGRSLLLPATSYTPATTASTSLRYLPAAPSTGDALTLEPLGPVSRRSRSLLEAAPSEGSSSAVPAVAAAMVNQTLEALLQDPNAAAVPERALRQLQDLAPAAVLLDAPSDAAASSGGLGDAAGADTLAASTAFPTLADQFFKAAGLDAPQTCQKVFEFDAATLPHPGRSRRQVERFITGTYGFKGRSVGLPTLDAPSGATMRLPALALPEATAADGDAVQDDEEEIPAAATADTLPLAVTEPTLVSVLLPTNASRGEDSEERGLTAVDRVFVVLLHPGDRFMTYSCGLSRPVLA